MENSGAVNYPPVMAARLLLLNHADLVSPKVQRAIIDYVPWKRMHQIRDMVDIMHDTSLEIFEAAKRSANEGDELGRKDIISALCTLLALTHCFPLLDTDGNLFWTSDRANSTASDEDRIPDSELVAQVSYVSFSNGSS